jgi:hypothetical protein
MTDALKTLLEAAKHAKPTPEEREVQRRSFAFGNTAFENTLITREMVSRHEPAGAHLVPGLVEELYVNDNWQKSTPIHLAA